jgi:hypothetical protein
LGEAGGLKKGDKLYLFFENGFTMPSSYEKGVFLNDQHISVDLLTMDPEKLMLAIQIDTDLENGQKITILVTPDVGIRNPPKQGEYSIGVSSTREPKTIKSGLLLVIPLPETDLLTNPVAPDGKNNWYINDCDVSFVVHAVDKERVKTYFSINGKEFILYSSSFKLSSGEYEIAYYSSYSETAKEVVKKMVIKVDTTKPILDLSDHTIYTNQNPYPLSLVLIESHFAFADINGQRIDSLMDGKIKISLTLNTGENTFVLIVADLAGNETERTIKIVLDNTPPTLTIFEPFPWTKTIRKKLTIHGKTEPLCMVSMNDQMVNVESDGSFSFTLELNAGLNAIAIVSSDLAGNQKIYSLPIQYYPNFQAKFKIGSSIAETSFGKIDLPSPIYLEKGTAMVPLRVFTELLGCSVEFEPVFQIITIQDPLGTIIKAQIGNTIFTVNQTKKTLPVPPAIRKNSTFIPVRFFAEEFGFIISYEKKEQTVILRYNER